MIKIKNSGFTLVEILVALVIGVISIGAIFASYQYFNQTHQSVSQKAAISQSGREALLMTHLDEKIESALQRIEELLLLIEHWKEQNENNSKVS